MDSKRPYVSVEEKKKEAVRRMAMLNLSQNVIRDFINYDMISLAEPPYGFFRKPSWEELREIKAWEKENNALVYCVVRDYASFGTLNVYLFVGDYAEDWGAERYHGETDSLLSYVVNLDALECSEYGCVGIKKTMGSGLVRIW